MTNQEILLKLNEIKKGKYISLTKKKDLGNGLVKNSKMVIRLGINFANMKVNEGRETGSLPWGHWVEGLENLVIEHTNKKGETNYYLRVANSYADNTSTEYLLNGEVVSKEVAIATVGEKKLQSQFSDVYNIKFENIIALGQ
jgi:hypothetical protein